MAVDEGPVRALQIANREFAIILVQFGMVLGNATIVHAQRMFGATSLLDQIEETLPLAHVLELQQVASAQDSHALEALDGLPSLRAEARARLTGRGMTRSYAIAAMWATLASAAGDAEGAAILEELDERARLAGDGATALWDAQLDAASGQAMQAWIERDVPGRLGLE